MRHVCGNDGRQSIRSGSANGMRGRSLEIQWAHTAEELAERLSRERNQRLRQRLQALLLLRQGQRIGEVSDAMGVHYRTLQRWVDWYRRDGLEAVLERTPGYNAPGNPSKLTPEQSREVIARYEAGEFRTIRDAVAWVEEHFGVTYTPSGLRSHMRTVLERSSEPALRG